MTESTPRLTVALIYGGASSEHNVSCMSAASVIEHLGKNFDVLPVGITTGGRWMVGESDPAHLRGDETSGLPSVSPEGTEVVFSLNPKRRGEFRFIDGTLYGTADVMFPLLHGIKGEDGAIQGLFELCYVPYVGTGVFSSAAGMDKEFTKKLCAASGLAVADGLVLRSGDSFDFEDIDRLGLPLFVKPARGGSSIGISKVTRSDELREAINQAFLADTKLLIEAELRGPEVEVGVLEYPDGRVVASSPAQLNGTCSSDEGFYDFTAKYVHSEQVHAQIPAPLSADTTRRVKEMARAAFRALDCQGLARVDFFITDAGPVINEINTMPGFTPISMFPQVFAADGVEYSELLRIMVETAVARTPVVPKER